MQYTSFAFALLSPLLALGLPAQQTIVVDAGGGGQFADMPEAVAAAQPGDTLLVKPGAYSFFSISKGLRVLGEPGVTAGNLFAAFAVSNLPAGEAVVIRDVDPDNILAAARVSLTDNLGYVHLENLTLDGGLDVHNCAQVSVHRSSVAGTVPAAADVRDSTALFSRTRIQGLGSLSFPGPGLRCTNSTVIFAEAVCIGPDATFRSGPGPALQVVSGDVTVTGDSSTAMFAGSSGFGALSSPAILVNGGTLNIDPTVQVVPTGVSPPISGDGGRVVVDHIASMRADATNSVLSLRVFAPGALQAITVASFPRVPPLNTPFGPFWFTNLHLVIDAGPVVGNERQASLNLPPLTPGAIVLLQAVVARPTGPEMSMPAVLTVDT